MRIDRLTLGALLMGVVIGMATLAGLVSPQDPIAQDPRLAVSAPDRFHPFGTDRAGRDVLSRVVHAGRSAVLSCASASLLAALIALLAVRETAAARGRWRVLADGALERFGLIPSPALVLIGAQLFRCDTPGGLALLLGFTTWGPVARPPRGAQDAGMPPGPGSSWGGAVRAAGWNSLRRTAPLLLMESGLSFVGLGLAPPTPSWGAMIREWLWSPASGWWIGTFPAAALAVSVLAFGLTGGELRPPSLFSRHE